MVAVRSAHLNPDQQFELETWIASLTQEGKTAAKLTAVYRDCEQLLAGNPQGPLLLWRGREMIEILITLSMDRPTLVAALLFPIATSGVLDNESLEEGYGREVVKLIHGVEEMAAIGQLNVTMHGSEASAQVDNVRRMLLAMVDDFRCVVIKLAERICNLREVKNEPDEVRRVAAKECANIYAPLANRLGIGQLKWEIEDYAFRYQQPDTYKQIAKQLSERRIVREQYIRDFVSDLRAERSNPGLTLKSAVARNTSTASGAKCRRKASLLMSCLMCVRCELLLISCKTVTPRLALCTRNTSTYPTSLMTM